MSEKSSGIQQLRSTAFQRRVHFRTTRPLANTQTIPTPMQGVAHPFAVSSCSLIAKGGLRLLLFLPLLLPLLLPLPVTLFVIPQRSGGICCSCCFCHCRCFLLKLLLLYLYFDCHSSPEAEDLLLRLRLLSRLLLRLRLRLLSFLAPRDFPSWAKPSFRRTIPKRTSLRAQGPHPIGGRRSRDGID